MVKVMIGGCTMLKDGGEGSLMFERVKVLERRFEWRKWKVSRWDMLSYRLQDGVWFMVVVRL